MLSTMKILIFAFILVPFAFVSPHSSAASVGTNVGFRLTFMTQKTCRCGAMKWVGNHVTTNDTKTTFETAALAQTAFLENLPQDAADIIWYDQNKDGIADVIRYNSQGYTSVLGINTFLIETKTPTKLPFKLNA
jgi:hypothetical protein